MFTGDENDITSSPVDASARGLPTIRFWLPVTIASSETAWTSSLEIDSDRLTDNDSACRGLTHKASKFGFDCNEFPSFFSVWSEESNLRSFDSSRAMERLVTRSP